MVALFNPAQADLAELDRGRAIAGDSAHHAVRSDRYRVDVVGHGDRGFQGQAVRGREQTVFTDFQRAAAPAMSDPKAPSSSIKPWPSIARSIA